MKTILWMTGWLTALFISAAAPADFVPNYISYEGTVLDEFGQPGVGSRSFLFSLSDANGAVRWQEGHLNVPLSAQGAFQVLLGKIVTLPELEPSWSLNVTLRTGSSSWKELTPTQALTTVMYALQADDARRAPGDLTVRQDLRVAGSLMATSAPVLLTRLNTADVTADSVRSTRLAVSDLSGKTNSPIVVSNNLELTQGLVVKGSVSMMKVMNFSEELSTNLSGRVYLLAPKNRWNLYYITLTPAAGGNTRLYEYNLPNNFYFLPLDMNPGDRLRFYNTQPAEIPPSAMNNEIKLVRMGQ